MSILTDIRKLAHKVARDGLERAGLHTYDIPKDDEYLFPQRDILDILLDKSGKPESIIKQVDPIPVENREDLKKEYYPYCGDNQSIRETLEMWIEHREDVIACTNDNIAPDPDRLKSEALDILTKAGVIQTAGDNGLEAIQRVAQAQNRPVINLLRMASYQCMADSLEGWIDLMNQKLVPFNLKIVDISGGKLSLMNE